MLSEALDNPVNPFSLTGARCRLRSPSARKSPLRGDMHRTDITHFNEHSMGLTFRHSKGSATIDPDEFFAEIGVTEPKFTETGRKLMMLPKPTPVSSVLRPKRPGSVGSPGSVPATPTKNRARCTSEQAQKRSTDALKMVKTMQNVFLTEPVLEELLPEQQKLIDRKVRQEGSASTSSNKLIKTLIKNSAEKLENLTSQTTEHKPATPVKPETPKSPARLQTSVYKNTLREDVRQRFSTAQALKQMAQIRADEGKMREQDRVQFETALFSERSEKIAHERDINVLQAKLEAANHEIESLRTALFLLTRKHEVEHERLLKLELEAQKHRDAQPLIKLLDEQFSHMPPEEVLRKIEVLESANLQTFNKVQDTTEALKATESLLIQERLDHGNKLQKLGETVSLPIHTLEKRVSDLTAENEKLNDDLRIVLDSQERYLALSFAVAELWSQWIDPKTHNGGVAKLAGRKGEGLDPDLSKPMEVLRCIGNLLSICFPQVEASSTAFRKIATLANRAWSRILSADDTDCLLKYNIHAILEECCNRAENGHKTELYLKGIIRRLELENKRISGELARTEQRCKQLGNLTRSTVASRTSRPSSGYR
ncbi:Chromosome segregation protein SMC [Giardia duodenalis]|uniref:Chromosome segregation protein SMC n=2 Tax=Giardia intestinalis TaxID=5741 RepID=C6LZ05_GIAIB|nr:Hypothetical protein GL50581_4034 [Giardia intestinalis ATCC 50581]ESU44214.1 Chromosome segregation protein SMC [Giardia intestinalis]